MTKGSAEPPMRETAFLVRIARFLTATLCRALLSLRTKNLPEPCGRPRIYAANHVSHADFVALWTALPADLRAKTRPVAGADYWLTTKFRSWLITRVFRAVLVERKAPQSAQSQAPADSKPPSESDVIPRLAAPLQAGEDLILFPEGTRNLSEETLLRMRSGIYLILQLVPEAEVVPAWISHMDRILPKGGVVPVPLNCTLTFGAPLRLEPNESRDDFLKRLRAAILACKAEAL